MKNVMILEKIVFSCLLTFVLLLAGIIGIMPEKVVADDGAIYFGETETYTFGRDAYNSDGTLKYFTPYFSALHNGIGSKVNLEDYWINDFDNKTITTDYSLAKYDNGNDIEMYSGNATYLTLATKKYQYFEAILIFRYSDVQNSGWIGITFGQSKLGYGYQIGGGGNYAFAQKEGTCTMIGELITATSEGVIPSKDKQEAYINDKIQLRLRVFGTDATVETLNEDGSVVYGSLRVSDPLSNTKISNSKSFRLQDTEGYVSIMSAAGYHTIESFSITPIERDDSINTAQTQIVFNSEKSLVNFIAYYTKSGDSFAKGEKQNILDQWSLTNEHSLLRIDGLDVGVDGNVSHLIWDEEIKYFEATITYRNKTGNDGWIGFEFGLGNLDDRFVDSAHGAFIQMNGTPTLAGVNKTTSSTYEEGNAGQYNISAWHTFRLRVTENSILFYVDDLNTPLYSTKVTNVQDGFLGILTTGISQLEVRSFTLDRLNNQGYILKNQI